MAKTAKPKKVKVSMRAVHREVRTAIAKLKKIKDPIAAQLVADLMMVNSETKCGQVMVFKFSA